MRHAMNKPANAFSALALGVMALAGGMAALPQSAEAQGQYRQQISNNMSACRGAKPAVRVTVTGVKSSTGKMRVQSYRGTKAEWLEKGKWLNRIEMPARAGSMSFCMPVPASGSYGIAVRHDVNGNGKTDIRTDGGAMSNNPSINIFNLGKPSYKKTRFDVGSGVKAITVNMRYF